MTPLTTAGSAIRKRTLLEANLDDIARLLAALEKCREQRNDHVDSGGHSAEFIQGKIEALDAELAAILSPEGEK